MNPPLSDPTSTVALGYWSLAVYLQVLRYNYTYRLQQGELVQSYQNGKIFFFSWAGKNEKFQVANLPLESTYNT